MNILNGQGVLYVVAHLIITLAVIGAYIYSVATGHPDDTFKVALFTIIGYWFGAVGIDKITSNKKNNGGSGNE